MVGRSLILALVMMVLSGAVGVRAQAAPPDPSSFLPPKATVLRTVLGDVDGDGQPDSVVLYSVPGFGSGPADASLLVLLARGDGYQPAHLFGAPPKDLRGNPVLFPGSTAELALTDLTGDGRAEIVLTITSPRVEASRMQELYVFGRGEAYVPPPDRDTDFSPPEPSWAGSGFRLEAHLEGATVTVEPPPAGSGGASVLRRQASDPHFDGRNLAADVSETYTWRNDGFRLAERSLTLPADASGADGSPVGAILGFYSAVGRGDLQTATGLLSDELRASRSSTQTINPNASGLAQRVEEVRILDDYLSRPRSDATERRVYVRVSMADPAATPTGGDAGTAGGAARRQTIAGSWRVKLDSGRWRLAEASLHPSADLAVIADVLPPGVTLVQTAGGNLRGRGVEDLAVLISGPGRYPILEPYLILAGASGLEAGVPLVNFVPGGLFGGVAGIVEVADVTGDGVPEIVFNAGVGAHGSVLWVLRWDGSTLAPLFAEASNSPSSGLEDLDGDGVPEIVLGVSGYCGSYAASPHMMFAFRWENGAYRSASWRYPSLNIGIDEYVERLQNDRQSGSAGGSDDGAAACVQHMLAESNAFRGKPAEMRTAYRAYAALRQQVPSDKRAFILPTYIPATYLEADLRAVLAVAESGTSPNWGPAELAVLHDLLGDALMGQSDNLTYRADHPEDGAKPGRTDEDRTVDGDRSAAAEAVRPHQRERERLHVADELRARREAREQDAARRSVGRSSGGAGPAWRYRQSRNASRKAGFPRSGVNRLIVCSQ